MINREIIYERNLTGSYMKIPVSFDSEFDEKMMLKRKIPGILPVEKCYVNGAGQYWYNISGRQSLDTYCRIRNVGIDMIEKIIVGICSEIEILEWNLLTPDSLLLDPELIFITNSNQEVIFAVYPGAKSAISAEFQQLMEYLLTKIDHTDAEAVRMAYAIYEKTMDEGYNLMDIRDFIVESRRARNGEIEARQEGKPGGAQRAKFGRSVEDGEKVKSGKDSENNVRGRHRKDPENSVRDKFGKSVTVPAKAGSEGTSEGKAGSGKWERFPKILEEKWEELRQAIGELVPFNLKKKEKEQDLAAEGYGALFQPVYPEDARREEELLNERKMVPINPTVYLGSYMEGPKGILRYEGGEGFPDIKLLGNCMQIGKGEDVDIAIPKETVSHFHAKIDHQGEDYYIEDLNSTNGTFVNDETLPYKERRRLQANDTVRFADVDYRFT